MQSIKVNSSGPPGLPRGFLFFICGAFLSNVGTWMQTVSLGWLVAQLTREPLWVGVVGFCAGIPNLFVSYAGGIIADHVDRRKLLLATQMALMSVAILLSLLTALHWITIWQIALLALLNGCATALNNPTYSGFLFDIVGRENITRAVSLNSTQLHFSRALGPLLAGIAIGGLGIWGCFAVNAVSFLAVLPFIALIPVMAKQETRSLSFERVAESFQEGIAYVRSHSTLHQSLALMAITTVLVIPHINLLPLFVKDVLRLGPRFLGSVWAISACGSVFTTIWYGKLATRRPELSRAKSCLFGAALCSMELYCLSHARLPWTLYPLLFVIGAFFTLVTLSNQLMLQEQVSPGVRGRALGIWNTLFLGMFPIGNFLIGALAEATSISLAWRISAVILFVYVVAIPLRRKRASVPTA